MLYNTKLELVEPTKMLERITVDNLRFINPLGHDYVSGAYTLPTPSVNSSGSPTVPPQMPTTAYKNIVDSNNVQILGYTIYQVFLTKTEYLQTTVTVTVNGNQIYTGQVPMSQPNGYVMTTLNVASGNNITIVYKAKYESEIDPGTYIDCEATITTYSVTNTVPKEPYTITQVINRILNAGLGRQNGYFTLDPAIATAWENIPAPEFEITGKTLYEALLIVGGYKDIQAIPRLGPTPNSENDWEYNFITFDSLNGAEVWTPPVPKLDYHYEQNAESYCGGIESYVDNFVDNSGTGTTGLPFPTTVRTESSELIIDGNYAIIKTKFPIYKVNNLSQAYINSSGAQVGDITPFVFEYSEYKNLTSYVGQFPTAKQFAFYYIQGQPNIYGLCLKPETATTLGIAIQQMAAVQIAQNKSGQSYNSTNGVASFAYTISYTPIQTRRLRQYRPVEGEFPDTNILYYNQSANIVDSRNYGGRMKAELARIGNPTEIETYRLSALSQVPKAGMLKDGKYISQVNWEIGINYIKVSIYLVKNYNRLNEYVGINSMQRFYEVSEKQATQRACNFSFFATVGNFESADSDVTIPLASSTTEAFALTFQNTNEDKTQNRIAFAVVQPLTENGTPISGSLLQEVSANGFGNSSGFYFAFEDNYSAGPQAVYNASARKLQKAVPYGDEYGSFYKLQIDFYSYGTQKNGGALTYSDQVSTPTSAAWCDQLPLIQSSDFTPEIDSSFRYCPTIDKNSGESVSIETQLHFQANLPTIVIGTALGSKNTLVSSVNVQPIYVCLPYNIQILQDSIPTADVTKYAVAQPNISAGAGQGHVLIGPITNTTNQPALSWACVDNEGNIFVANNENIPVGGKSTAIYINLIFK